MKHGTRKEYMKGTRRWHGYGGRFPLERFLFSRLGRLWADVHSELSEEFDRRTYSGYCFWRSLDGWDVAENCWIGAETGTVYTYHRWGDGTVDGFYVHPFTGILSYQKKEVAKRPDAPITKISLSDRTWIEKILGIWYYIESYRIEHEGMTQIPPTWRKEPVEVDGEIFYKVFWNEDVYNKRQLSHEELRKNKLTNDTPEQIKEAAGIQAEKSKEERRLHKERMEKWREESRLAAEKAIKDREAKANGASL